ncbi:MAG TPA: flagellar hook-associated protein FlgK [Anaeromyxobacter sp.]|nr:flagellar hook-associated protein FlgK [Anaeromyxobacter sp.]
MSDLFRILGSAASSLDAQTAAAATTSHNLENSNTPGYARQRVSIETTLPAEEVGNVYIGQGAQVASVTQVRDGFLEAQLPSAFGQASSSSATASTLQAVDALDPQASGGLGDAVSGFYAALSQLAQNAADPGLRQSAVSAAQTLATSFNQTRGALEEARTGVDQKLSGDVAQVNDLAQTVASLNGQIRAARAGGAEPNDLLDARQQAVDQLAQLSGALPVATSEGDVSLFLSGGAPLVTSLKAGTLSAVPDPANGGHLGLELKAGGVQRKVSPGGELGGLLSARDGALETAVNSLDTLAFDFSGAVNAVHQAGVDLSGNAGQPLFSVTALNGAAAQIAVNAAIAANPALLATAHAGGGPGDASNVNDLLKTQSQLLSGGLDASGTLSQVTSAFGATAASAKAQSDADGALRDHLTTLRASASGVSIDEELIAMQKTQQAYQAISKVLQTTNDLFTTLMSIKPT